MHDFDIRHERSRCVGRVFEIPDHCFFYFFALSVQRRHVNSFNLFAVFENFRFRKPALLSSLYFLKKFGQHIFAFAHFDDIEKLFERLGIYGARPARYQYRVFLAAVFCVKRNFRKVKHIENIAVQHFVLHRKTDRVEILKRNLALDAEKRQIVFAQFSFHIRPGRETSLANHIGHRV